MRFYKNMDPLPMAKPAAPNKRRKGRIRADMLQTNIGAAVDLSETGVRIQSPRDIGLEPGTAVLLTLKVPSREISCPAKVCWKRKVGWFKTEMGLEFLDRSETFTRSLRELSSMCMDLRTISADAERFSETG